jgi:putative ABC transport system ATP-binding protein
MLIEMKDVKKTYLLGNIQVPALRGISLQIHADEYVAVMGPSGSGKSTLMNLLGCLDSTSEGAYYLDGRDVSYLSDNRLSEVRNSMIGFVFQTFNLLPRSTALHNVELPLIYQNVPSAERKRLAREALDQVGLSDRTQHRPNELSGGQRQRVAIARALVNKPSLILADEPTGNLDSKTGAEIMDVIKELYDQGVTIVLVTHEEYIAASAKRTLRLRDGLIEAPG